MCSACGGRGRCSVRARGCVLASEGGAVQWQRDGEGKNKVVRGVCAGMVAAVWHSGACVVCVCMWQCAGM